jgi:hypothetical protein
MNPVQLNAGAGPEMLNQSAALARMNSDELRLYLEFVLWHYKVVDGFWFLFTSEATDQQHAEKLNERVWARVSVMAAKDLIKRFGLQRRGLEGFVDLLRLYPWTLLIGYQVEHHANEVLLTVPSCPSQQSRLKRGLGEYVCKAMHQAEFENLARAVDERIRVECLFAPPDPHPADCFCRWRFWLDPPN